VKCLKNNNFRLSPFTINIKSKLFKKTENANHTNKQKNQKYFSLLNKNINTDTDEDKFNNQKQNKISNLISKENFNWKRKNIFDVVKLN